MCEKKSPAATLKEQLFLNRKNGRNLVSAEELEKCDAFCEDYKTFLDNAKTEREAVDTTIEIIEKAGFVPFQKGIEYKAGDKVYYNNRGKAIAIAVIGSEPVEKGVRIAAAHIDSPRLDLKPNPLYESDEIALFKTHYYGGIKKYQWTTIPLSLHGVFCKKDGTTVKVNIGEDEGDPKFVITDLLPHLAADQMGRKLSEGIKGEELNILVGSHPLCDDESDAVKLNILKLLNEKYGVTEADFLSAELECVPAAKACDIGLDRSMIGSYGHDDRVCAYPAIRAILDIDTPKTTAVTILADKEETGSGGNTGMESAWLKYFIYDLAKMQGGDIHETLANSKCLSADVNAALDPTFSDVSEKRNASLINYGAVITKYTGARGKSGTSDASAEYVSEIRAILDKAGIVWQHGELGKVDMGGGGTVAVYIANLGLDVIDLGVPVLSMHAPFEVVAKLDVYMTYRTVYEFYKA